MIQTYFGNGKGKTTAAIGSAIRCAGCKNSVLFVQFLKNNDSAEFKILKTINNIDLLYSDVSYNLYDNLNQKRKSILTKAYSTLLFDEVLKSAKKYKMIILDEILDSIAFEYIDENKFLRLLAELKNDCEIILTGHTLSKKIANISDYISEIKEISHPYTKGISPREGIEF